MAMIRNFVIDRVISGTMFHKTQGYALYSLNQITNPSLSVTAENSQAVDALGVPIAIFDRGKQAEFSAENALLDMGLMAAQAGTELEEASSSNTFLAPYRDEITVSTAGTVALSKTPAAGTLKFVYVLNGDGSLGERYKVTAGSGTPSAENPAYWTGTTVTMQNTVATVGSHFVAYYDITANGDAGYEATRLTNSATNFPTGGRFVLDVLGCDPCDVSTLMYLRIEFLNAKLTSDFDLTFATDSTHPFTIQAMQDYCDIDKILYRIYLME